MSSPNYQTRPSKHVERKIFVETFQHLRNAGYNISKYHYLGFGSFYYMDFILFNRLLTIKKMTCLENNIKIEKRMKFNKPLKFIKLKMDDITNYLPVIKSNERYIVWLDFESQLTEETLSNVGSLVGTLMNESILVVTVNAHINLHSEEYLTTREKQIIDLQKKYNDELNPFCGVVKKSDITKNGVPALFARSIKSKIDDSLRGRPDDDFYQLFNFVYKDGLSMLTFGGVIDKKGNKKIKESLKDLKYINSTLTPKSISIPSLTTREKLLLDQKAINKINVAKLPFEIAQKEIDDYIEYALHYPTFNEVFTN